MIAELQSLKVEQFPISCCNFCREYPNQAGEGESVPTFQVHYEGNAAAATS